MQYVINVQARHLVENFKCAGLSSGEKVWNSVISGFKRIGMVLILVDAKN